MCTRMETKGGFTKHGYMTNAIALRYFTHNYLYFKHIRNHMERGGGALQYFSSKTNPLGMEVVWFPNTYQGGDTKKLIDC